MARWGGLSRSSNVEDRRGLGGGAAFAGGGGLIAVLITLGLSYFGLQVPQSTVEEIIGQIQSLQSTQVDESSQPVEFRGDDDYQVFTEQVLGSSDELWTSVFSSNKRTYEQPRLVLFRGVTESACGVASSQVGPHYCPIDNTIYLDETFFEELKRRYGGSTGEVAQAYVITHEVGHHVQNQLGSLNTRTQSSRDGAIQLELQADCYAGVWAHAQAQDDVFGGGEIQQALDAAAAVGDDNIQQRSGGRVTPENWTHGSSEQRVDAFTTGYDSGDPGQCVGLG